MLLLQLMDNQQAGSLLSTLASKYSGVKVAGNEANSSQPTSDGAMLANLAGKHTKSGSISTVTNAAIKAGANPQVLANAYDSLGRTDYIGLCERFVENTQGKSGIYPSAADAWNAQLNNASNDMNSIQPGDEVYFAPDSSNHYQGHTGIYTGNNKMISATDNGVEQSDLNDWQNQTGQKLLGYVRSQGGQNGQ